MMRQFLTIGLVMVATIAFSSMHMLAQAVALDRTGYETSTTPWPFADLEKRVTAAIAQNGMNLVNRASASDGAHGRGVTIRGDVVLGVFRNDFAVRMLAADVDAGIEAPIRLHLTEEPDGKTMIRYRRPSYVFGQYDGEAIKALGRELDPIFERIIADAIAP